MIIEGRTFTNIPGWVQFCLVVLIAMLVILCMFLAVDKAMPDNCEHWKDPAIVAPEPDKVVMGVYLIDGKEVPMAVKMVYLLDNYGMRSEFWSFDSEVAQADLGRPYRWCEIPLVPAGVLWATKKG